MITPAPLIAATGLRFRQRFHHDPDGTIRTVLHDGKAVRLTASQYEDVVAHFSKHSAPHHQMLRRRFNASIPIILLTLAITFGTHLSREIDKLPVPGAAVAAPLILLTWWPLLALFLHWRGIRALEAAIDVGLGSLPTAPSPPRRSHATQALQIVALFVIGPGLLIDIVGSLLPHAFDNTPLMGRSINWLTLAGLLLILVLIGLHRRERSKRSAPGPDGPASAAEPGRMAAVAQRARSADDQRH